MAHLITIRITRISEADFDVAKSGKHQSYLTYLDAVEAAHELFSKAGGPSKALILDLAKGAT